MAVYRQIQITFWQDKFILSLTPEEKFFYIYLLTNSKTKQCGIYELPTKIIETETGYNRETVIKLIQRFIDHKKIAYDWENEEVFLLNWVKHNPFDKNKNISKCIENELKSVHNKEMIPLTSPLQVLLQKEKEQKEEEEQEVQNIWIKTFGRNPRLPEYEETVKLIKTFGKDKVLKIYRDATLKGFKNLGTLIDQLDEQGNIKPREGFNNTITEESNTEMSADLKKIKAKILTDKEKNGY